ncbi:MAG: lysylphosphatidylglycerol synthase transmembrane domain-containing protein [Balneolales bacterium]
MRSTVRNILLSLLVGGLFLWLAIRNVPFDLLFGYMQGISYGWIIPYSVVALLSHFLRAERWRLLIRHENKPPARASLFAGVMFGYLVNYAVPRLGEISRCVYVAKKEDLSGTNLVGTVILERVIDMLIMLILIAFVGLVLISDPEVLSMLLGEETRARLQSLLHLRYLMAGLVALPALLLLGYVFVLLIRKNETASPMVNKVLNQLRSGGALFMDGLFAIRHLRQWPYFTGLTILIWAGYVIMAYIPFVAFNLHEDYGLGLEAALVIMTISSVGVALPSPGGIGTYHWFVRQGLLVLYGVPAANALAYAFVTHAVMMGVVVVTTPVILVWNKGLKRKNTNRSANL